MSRSMVKKVVIENDVLHNVEEYHKAAYDILQKKPDCISSFGNATHSHKQVGEGDACCKSAIAASANGGMSLQLEEDEQQYG